MVTKGVVAMILVLTLVATQVESMTQSLEFEPNKMKGPLCEARCDVICAKPKHIKDYAACVKACVKQCYPPAVKKT